MLLVEGRLQASTCTANFSLFGLSLLLVVSRCTADTSNSLSCSLSDKHSSAAAPDPVPVLAIRGQGTFQTSRVTGWIMEEWPTTVPCLPKQLITFGQASLLGQFTVSQALFDICLMPAEDYLHAISLPFGLFPLISLLQQYTEFL